MDKKNYLYPLLAILFWSGNVIVSKMASHQISPIAMTCYRLILALAVMATFVLIPTWRNRHTIFQYWKHLALGGFLSVSLFQFLSYQAAATTTATNMAIVTALIPLITIILSVFILKEKIHSGLVIGSSLSFFGILYLLGHGHISEVFTQGVHVGDVLMLSSHWICIVWRITKALENANSCMASKFCDVSFCTCLCFSIFCFFTCYSNATQSSNCSNDFVCRYFFLHSFILFMD